MALVLIDHEEREIPGLYDEMLHLPASDLSLLVALPRLHDAALQRLSEAVADDDVDEFLSASPLQAVAVAWGTARTPSGLLVAGR